MRVGVPAEVKNHEYRVAITPAGVHELTRQGHDVLVQAGAGTGSSITDDEFTAAGAKIAPSAEDVWQDSELILKVKEPIAIEYGRMRPGQVLFTYLHLAASRDCTRALLDRKVTGIAYETVQLSNGDLAAAGPDERGSRSSRTAGRCLSPDAARRRPGHPDGRRLRRLCRESGGDRRRGLGHERRGYLARHAGRGIAPGPQHRQVAGGGQDLPGSPADRRLQHV